MSNNEKFPRSPLNVAQRIMGGIGQPPKEQPSMADIFDGVAKKAGKTTIAQFHPDGGVLVWVTKDEVDPVSALLHAAINILIRRGQHDGRVQVRRVSELVAPGCEIAWQVTDEAGEVIAKGYAKDEQEAAERVAEAMRLPKA